MPLTVEVMARLLGIYSAVIIGFVFVLCFAAHFAYRPMRTAIQWLLGKTRCAKGWRYLLSNLLTVILLGALACSFLLYLVAQVTQTVLAL